MFGRTFSIDYNRFREELMAQTLVMGNPAAVAAKNNLAADFRKKGILIALLSGLLYGFYTAFMTLGMSLGIWVEWYGENSGLSAFAVMFLLSAIGGVYRQQAEIALGGIFEGSVAALRARGQAIKSQFNAANLALKVYRAQAALERLEAEEKAGKEGEEKAGGDGQGAETHSGASDAPEPLNKGASPTDEEEAERARRSAAAAEERARLEEASLPLMLEAMWAANVLDIQSTLRHVTRAVLHDKTVDKRVRARRGEALLELGKIFREAAGSAAGTRGQMEAARPTSGEDARRRMEDAMMQAIEKKAGQ